MKPLGIAQTGVAFQEKSKTRRTAAPPWNVDCNRLSPGLDMGLAQVLNVRNQLQKVV